MCVVWGGGKLGLSYYEVDMAILHIMPDVAESQDFGLLRRGRPAERVIKRVWEGLGG